MLLLCEILHDSSDSENITKRRRLETKWEPRYYEEYSFILAAASSQSVLFDLSSGRSFVWQLTCPGALPGSVTTPSSRSPESRIKRVEPSLGCSLGGALDPV